MAWPENDLRSTFENILRFDLKFYLLTLTWPQNDDLYYSDLGTSK